MVVTADGRRPLESDVLRGMFEARKHVFVDLLKWDVPVVAGRYEIDQFDDEHATYIIVTDRHGNHLGSARLLKTTRPHILGSLFPALCAGPVPTGPEIYEITRFCLGRHQGSAQRRATRDRLVSALVSHALENRIAAYTGVAEMAWLQQILAFGWRCRPLGLPRVIGNSLLGALRIDIGPETPALLQRTGVWAAEPAEEADALAA
jgi:N-acyl-L-homoserine lactone synthetase